MGDDDTGFTVLWEFVVAPSALADFRRAYGPAGAWVALFRRGSGHVETRLLEDRSLPGRFVTVDRWTSAEAYRAFRQRFASEYEMLDAACAGFSEREKFLGEFEAPTA
jgi:quinol monooxygenase YgiN